MKDQSDNRLGATQTVKPGKDVSSQLRDIEERFKVIAGEDEQIDVHELQQGLSITDEDYATRIFNLVDEDSSGTISLWEFIEFARVLIDGSADEKLRIVFDLHDLNGDGTIDHDELTHILDRSLNEHSLDISDQKLQDLSDALFKTVDTDGSGSITFSEFKDCIDAHPGLRDQMVATSSTWLQLPQRIAKDRRRRGRSFWVVTDVLSRMWENDRPWLILLALYAIGNIWMFHRGMVAEAALGSDLQTQIAQGAAEALKLNGALILVAMLRHTLTYLRRTPVGPYLPLDRMIEFHKVMGHTSFALVLVHIAGYIAVYESMVDPDFFTRDVIYGSFIESQVGWSGVSLIGIFIVMWIFSLEFVRRKGLFELFYVTHQLFWLWFLFLILHFPDFWMWVVVPGLWYIAEQSVRLVRGRKPAQVDQIDALPSNVTRVKMHRPDWFEYQAGEYVFVKHPAISKREWHPFTVTTNPEDKETLELHVRSVGTWTKRLNAIADQAVSGRDTGWDSVYLDGPYGSPASDIFDSKVPVLIGAGIGVTPFASILRSILHRRREAAGGNELPQQKVYFIWMNRDQQAFEWFVGLMRELEDDPTTAGMIDIRVYLTGLRAELTSASLTVAMEVYHETTGRDLLTGLRAPTLLSRPKWQAVFKEIRAAHPDDQVDVFYCGPEGLSRVLARESGRVDFGYKKENF